MTTTSVRITVTAALALALASGLAEAKKGKSDPALTCAASKHKAAGQYCGSVLKAWAKWEKSGDAAQRDASIGTARGKLDSAWTKAESKASDAGIDCATSFLVASAAGGFIDTASAEIAGAVNGGLALDDKKQAQCGVKLLRAAATKCAALLSAESAYHKKRSKASAAFKARIKAVLKASVKFAKTFEKATRKDCPTTATAPELEERVDAIAAGIVRDTLSSPEAGNGEYISIDGGPIQYEGREYTPGCLRGTPYRFFARRGTTNRLVVYYQGGGACWEGLTCSIPVCDESVTGGDNPANQSSGFADLDNPANPFRDWSLVFVSYCSCDVHFGDAVRDYDNPFDPGNPVHAEHRGFHNSKVVEKWAREHFLAPEQIFVTGSSAGAYGAFFNAPFLHQVWPSARFGVLGDAGNGVITQEFRDLYFPNWNFDANIPPEFPEIQEIFDSGAGLPEYTDVVADLFPATNWAHYTAAFDGGSGGQTGFYNVMLEDNDPLAALTWWEGSCAFNDQMRSQALAQAADSPENYRYYIGTGSRHTMWGGNKVYGDTTGGVPTIVDWVSAMLVSTPEVPDPDWANVECTDCGLLLPGDPRPSPLAPPFEQIGDDVKIVCPSSPAGAFVD